MIDAAKLAQEDPQKLEELAALYWFLQASSIAPDKLELGERPDFIMECEGRSIGVEITTAERALPGSPFTAQQIEAAQRLFAEKLLERIAPERPLNIGLIFNDEVPVDKSAIEKALNTVVPVIDRLSDEMGERSVSLLVRDEKDLPNSPRRKHICPAVPPFLQHIQLLSIGYEFSVITGSRGGFVANYSDEDLAPVLAQKHKALRGYRACAEQWLVIVAGRVAPIVFPAEAPRILIPSMASTFGEVAVSIPVQSDFDRVYFFKGPSGVTLLTA